MLFALFLIALLLTFGVSFKEAYVYMHALITGNTVEKKEESRPLTVAKKGVKEVAPKAATPQKEKAPSQLKINRPGAVSLAARFTPQKAPSGKAWKPPELNLLKESAGMPETNEAELHEKAKQIQEKLASFGIMVEMFDVNIGPSVMQYTLKPAASVKLSRIVGLKNDLALALSARSIRIDAPIAGTDLVGIEIPNEQRITVRIKDLLLSKEFNGGGGTSLKLTLGQDVSGKSMIADLAKMPHLLVAGQTGSGKSVAINSFLLSLIYQNGPDNLRLILVDPKRVELAPYNGIPHLLAPVINDPEKTIAALKWAVSEMTRRYQACAKAHVRSIGEFNAKHTDERMPYIVIVIDELADLMMVSGKEVEAVICRLAQLARAVGIHLIIATQRPSVDVITGLIKANIPTRIAFRVAQGVDSKTILDTVGAEDLLGQGDMLFIPPGKSEPVRVQGAFVETSEVAAVTNAMKLELGEEEISYDSDITSIEKQKEVEIPGVQLTAEESNESSDEDLVEKAAAVVVETGRASASLLQRRLSVGYARAARLIDTMEERGWVGPADGAKPRTILITAEGLAGLSSQKNTAQENAHRILDDMNRSRG